MQKNQFVMALLTAASASLCTREAIGQITAGRSHPAAKATVSQSGQADTTSASDSVDAKLLQPHHGHKLMRRHYANGTLTLYYQKDLAPDIVDMTSLRIKRDSAGRYPVGNIVAGWNMDGACTSLDKSCIMRPRLDTHFIKLGYDVDVEPRGSRKLYPTGIRGAFESDPDVTTPDAAQQIIMRKLF